MTFATPRSRRRFSFWTGQTYTTIGFGHLTAATESFVWASGCRVNIGTWGGARMTSHKTLSEFRAAWLPHISDRGLARLAELLERGSPILIHGSFQRTSVAGCLATHIAWHHPQTKHLNEEAGVIWLAHVAKLNPATSFVIQDWDRNGHADWELRTGLISLCRDEQQRRTIGDVRFDLRPITESAHPCLSA